MKVSVNIKVRNEDWYELDEEMQFINEDKIAHFLDFVDFEFTFDVEKYEDNRSTDYTIKLYLDLEDESKQVDFIVQDVSHIKFIGENQSCDVVVSNSLIRDYFGAQKKGSRHFWYFFLHGRKPYAQLGDNIWLDEYTSKSISGQYPDAYVRENPLIKQRKIGGVF
jgi:hypothetical protein